MSVVFEGWVTVLTLLVVGLGNKVVGADLVGFLVIMFVVSDDLVDLDPGLIVVIGLADDFETCVIVIG